MAVGRKACCLGQYTTTWHHNGAPWCTWFHRIFLQTWRKWQILPCFPLLHHHLSYKWLLKLGSFSQFPHIFRHWSLQIGTSSDSFFSTIGAGAGPANVAGPWCWISCLWCWKLKIPRILVIRFSIKLRHLHELNGKYRMSPAKIVYHLTYARWWTIMLPSIIATWQSWIQYIYIYHYIIFIYIYIYNYINHIMYRSIYDFYIYHIYIWYGTWSMPQRLNPSPSWGLATLTCHSKMTFVRENHRYKTVEMGESIGNISYIYISYILLGDHKIGILFPASFPRNGTIDVN